MDLDRLRYFCTVAKVGSIRGGAKILKITPGALSKAIRTLESELQMPLLVQDGRRIRISDEGKILVQKSESIVKDVEELKELVRVQAVEARPLKLGTFETFSTYFLRVLLKEALRDVPIVLQDLAPGMLEIALVEGRLDLGLTYDPVPFPDLDHFKVTPIEMAIFAKKGSFQAYRFSEIPFVVPAKPIFGAPTRVHGLDGWPDDQLMRDVRYQVTLMESAIEICELGLAAAYLPRFVVKLHNERVQEHYQLRELPLPAGISVRPQMLHAIKRKSFVENEASRQVIRAIRELGKESRR